MEKYERQDLSEWTSNLRLLNLRLFIVLAVSSGIVFGSALWFDTAWAALLSLWAVVAVLLTVVLVVTVARQREIQRRLATVGAPLGESKPSSVIAGVGRVDGVWGVVRAGIADSGIQIIKGRQRRVILARHTRGVASQHVGHNTHLWLWLEGEVQYVRIPWREEFNEHLVRAGFSLSSIESLRAEVSRYAATDA